MHQPPLRRILTHLSRGSRIQTKGKTPWELPQLLSANDTTFTPVY